MTDPKVTPYGSIRDLPSYREMADGIKAAKLITTVFGRDQRTTVRELEQELERLIGVAERFFEVLGPRNWIYHDNLDVSLVGLILDESADADEAERRFIETYGDPETARFRLMRLRNTDGLRERYHLIERAWDHYAAGEFDSCALHLVAVMDGFVNDFDAAARTGLAARDPDEMAAWDSVVGHHMGLTHALETFKKTIKKRVDDEVFELYRHGIVHGTVVRYDNVVVATKAWNMVFAVVDWARATEKSRELKPPRPTFGETLRLIGENARAKKAMAGWQPARLVVGDPGFEDDDVYVATAAFLAAWSERNYGGLARFSSSLDHHFETERSLPGRMRERFDDHDLGQFEITEVEHHAPAITHSRGTATVNGTAGAFDARWILEDADGNPGFGVTGAEWRLVFCDPSVSQRASSE